MENRREAFEKEYGQVWTTDELLQDFEVDSFVLGMAVATRKSDGARGTLMFTDSPRFYHSFHIVPALDKKK